jgi:hypothetical protein
MDCVVCKKVPIADWAPFFVSDEFYGWHCSGHGDYFHMIKNASPKCCGGQGAAAERLDSSSVLSSDYDADEILKE